MAPISRRFMLSLLYCIFELKIIQTVLQTSLESKIELDAFILAVGLGKLNNVKKDGSVVYLKNEWEHLLNMYQLYYYFDKFHVNIVPRNISSKETIVYESFWIGICSDNYLRLTSLSQFKHYPHPPQINKNSTSSF